MGNLLALRMFSGKQINRRPTTTRTEASSRPQSGLVAADSSAATSLQPRFRQAPQERELPPERQPSLTARTQNDQQQQFRERPPQPVNRRNNSNDKRSQVMKKYGYIPDNYTSLEQGWSSSHSQPSMERRIDRKRSQVMKKYAFIPDNYTTVDQVTAALREAGLESSNLIVGIDFTKSNEWTGKHSFRGQSLHKLGDQPNPYEQAITIIGKVLAPFDDDNLIPCFGFGDMTTHDTHVFSFHPDNSPCHGFEEVLSCYKKIVPHLRLAGPTSFAPIVEAAVDIIERNHGQYHVLLIIADGQVTRSVDTDEGELSPQERKTIDSIVMASAYPLSIVLVGVGDGPWDDMKKFDDKLPARDFDNFQFVNFTAIMGRSGSAAEKEAAFALAALMEVPLQYKATMELGILGQVTGKAKRVVPLPPPLPAAQVQRSYMPQKSRRPERSSTPQRSSSRSTANDDQSQTCPVCLTNAKDTAFGCGHMCCRDCAESLIRCPICRTVITSRLRVYTG